MAAYYNSYPSGGDPNLQFYSQGSSSSSPLGHQPTGGSMYGSEQLGGSIGQGSSGGGYASGSMGSGGVVVVGWWNAFGTGGIEGEEPLLEELGINFDHILQKSLTVLNPLKVVDHHIMDDADLAGPLVFCFIFAMLLLLSGKPQFSYIYGVALFGSGSIYALLNLMSESGIDAYRTASVLGYCLLPLVLLSSLTVAISLDGVIGYSLSSLAILWCSYSASSIFASVLHLHSQKMLVAYPISLLYAAFALLSVFDGSKR